MVADATSSGSFFTPFDPEWSVPRLIVAMRDLGPVVGLETALPSGPPVLHRVAGAPLWTLELRGGRWQVEEMRSKAPGLELLMQSAPTVFHALERAVDYLQRQLESPAGHAGVFGFLGYECNRRHSAPDHLQAFFLATDTVAQWRSDRGPARLWSRDPELAAAILVRAAQEDRSEHPPFGARGDESLPLFLPEDLDFERYRAIHSRLKDYLRRGDSYQLCFTYPIRRLFDGDPLDLYRDLRATNPSPFAAFVEGPGFALVSSSPERFLRLSKDGHVEARPMKGTIGRTGDPAVDERVKEVLLDSAKDQSENLMIADLLRNDLGRVCRLGSAEITHRAVLEEYSTVYQLVSQVEGDLRPGCTFADLLCSAFPPGSMTGAPKVRSVEILEEIEGVPRGAYSGALGYIAADGTMDLSVIIRSVWIERGVASCGVGSGVLFESTAPSEFEETRLKAKASLCALRRVHRGPWLAPR